MDTDTHRTDALPPVTFLKLGGSLITDKTQAATPREDVILRLAEEVRRALDAAPDLRLLIGHGSGSFGHWAAQDYGTRQGVRTPQQWRGFAEVSAAAAQLNRIVADAFLDAGVPVLSLQPSASARCRDYTLVHMDTAPITRALAERLTPLVYGDVALDDVHGGTIVSTEDLFVYLAGRLPAARILLVGETEGVLGPDGSVVARITPADLPALQAALGGSAGVDVTGGMADKVARMLALVARRPATVVHVLSGRRPGRLTRALLEPDLATGTRIAAR